MINSTTHISTNGQWCYKVTIEDSDIFGFKHKETVVKFWCEYQSKWIHSFMKSWQLIDLSKWS